MRIEQINSVYIRFIPENEKERKLLHTFPGFIKAGLEYFCKAKPHIVTNLVSRLRTKKLKLNLDNKTQHLISNTFKLKELPEEFKFFTEPLKHQLIALRFAYTVGSFGLLLDPGMGKTKIVLDYVALMDFKKTLVICPKALLFVWEDEQQIHRPDKSIYCVETTNWDQEKEKIERADIVVLNYNKAVILENQIRQIQWDYINIDEGLIKDPSTDRTKSITNTGVKVSYKSLSSGTLVNNTPLDVFAPVRFIEPSLTGYSFANFKDEYCVIRKGKHGEQETRFIVGYKKPHEMKEILHSCSIVMTKEEWLKDLPKKTFRNIIVQMSDEQRKVFEELQSNYITELNGTYIEIDNPLVALCKLLQVANGFLYLNNKDEEELELINNKETKTKKKKVQERETYVFQQQPKLDKLIDLLKNEFSNRRVIIWYNYSRERILIEDRLTDESVTFLTIAGGEKDTGSKVRNFNKNQKIQVLLCQAKAVNYGVTVLGISSEELEDQEIEVLPSIDTEVYTEIFYSRSFSLETYLQQQDRIHRIGQKHECEYIHLISNSSIEYAIVDALTTKMELRIEFLEDILKRGVINDLETSSGTPSTA